MKKEKRKLKIHMDVVLPDKGWKSDGEIILYTESNDGAKKGITEHCVKKAKEIAAFELSIIRLR